PPKRFFVRHYADFAASPASSGRASEAESDRQDDFADMRARFHQRVRSMRLLKGECLVDDWLHPAVREQRQDLVLDGAGDRALVGDRAGAKGRTGMVQPLE